MKIQEQIELTTPVLGAKVVIRGYVTGFISQEIEKIIAGSMVSSTEYDEEGKPLEQSRKSQVTGAQLIEARNRTIELMVLSVNGHTEDTLQSVLDLPEADWKYVRDQVDKVTAPLAASAESDSQTATTTSSPAEQVSDQTQSSM